MSEIRVNTIDTKDNTSLSIQQNNTTALTIDTSQNVGIGTTSPSVTFDAEADGATVAHFNRATSDGDIVELQKDGSSVGSIGSREGRMYLHSPSPTGSGLRMGDAFVQPCDSDGSDSDNDTALGQANSRFTDLYLSGNIYLGGTGSANALDDYEEGSWTPVLSDAGTGGNTATMGTATGSYTKIGRLVTLSVLCLDINTSGMTAGNVLHLQGLPFSTNTNNDAGRHRAAVLVDNINFTNYIMAETAPSSAVLQFQNVVDSSGDVQVKVQDILSAGSDIRFTFTYFSA